MNELEILDRFIETSITLTGYKPKKLIMSVNLYHDIFHLVSNHIVINKNNDLTYMGIKLTCDHEIQDGSITIKY